MPPSGNHSSLPPVRDRLADRHKQKFYCLAPSQHTKAEEKKMQQIIYSANVILSLAAHKPVLTFSTAGIPKQHPIPPPSRAHPPPAPAPCRPLHPRSETQRATARPQRRAPQSRSDAAAEPAQHPAAAEPGPGMGCPAAASISCMLARAARCAPNRRLV